MRERIEKKGNGRIIQGVGLGKVVLSGRGEGGGGGREGLLSFRHSLSNSFPDHVSGQLIRNAAVYISTPTLYISLHLGIHVATSHSSTSPIRSSIEASFPFFSLS